MKRRPLTPPPRGAAWVDAQLTDEQRWGQRMMEIRARAGKLARWPEGLDLVDSTPTPERPDDEVVDS